MNYILMHLILFFDGMMIKNINSINAPYKYLSITMFAFHSPIEDMWLNNNLTNLELRFSDILYNIHRYKNIKDIKIINQSPHKPILKMILRKKF